MREIKLVRALREGGNVRRGHCLPHHGEYTVGKHSFDALSLLMVLNPKASRHLMLAVLWHDVPERWTGDMPATFKWSSEAAREEIERAEETILRRLGIGGVFASLTDEERVWLSVVDQVEFYLWCLDQRALGNRHTDEALHEITMHLDRREDLPEEVVNFLSNYEFKRTEESMT